MWKSSEIKKACFFPAIYFSPSNSTQVAQQQHFLHLLSGSCGFDVKLLAFSYCNLLHFYMPHLKTFWSDKEKKNHQCRSHNILFPWGLLTHTELMTEFCWSHRVGICFLLFQVKFPTHSPPSSCPCWLLFDKSSALFPSDDESALLRIWVWQMSAINDARSGVV